MARSPNYPIISLRSAVEMAAALSEQYGRREMTDLEAVGVWGYPKLHGKSRRLLAALKHYGLLEDREGGAVTLTGRTRQILFPENQETELQHLTDALREPAVFLQIGKEFDDTPTPGRLVSYLINELDFLENAAKTCDRVYRDSVRFVEEFGKVHVNRHNMEGGDEADDDEILVADEEKDDKPPKGVTVVEHRLEISSNRGARLIVIGDFDEPDMLLLKKFLKTAQLSVLRSMTERLGAEQTKDLTEQLMNELRKE